MKKFISLMLTALMCAALAIPAAAVQEKGANAASVTATIPAVSKKPVLDGKVSAGEYSEIVYSTDDLLFFGINDDVLAKMKKTGFKIYASYSADTVYVAAVVDTPDYCQTSKNVNDIWQQTCLQVSGARVDETAPATRFEFGYAKNSDTSELMFSPWTDAYGSGFKAALDGSDFQIKTVNGVTTYEIAIPAKCFGVDKLEEGGKLGLNFTMNIGQSQETRGVIEWSQGCAINKDSTIFAKCTLTGKIKSAGTSASPATADNLSLTVLVIASMTTLCGVVVSKKRAH